MTIASIVLIVVAVIALLWFLKKSKIIAKLLIAIATICLVVFSAYSLGEINKYYNSKGGVWGALESYFSKNQVDYVEDLTFKLTNLELTQLHDDTYQAQIWENKVFSLEKDPTFGVYVNGAPCSYVEQDYDYVIAKYTHCFLNEDKEVTLTDTLTMQFAFYQNSTSLTIRTAGGMSAVKKWLYYFNKNGFSVTLSKTDYVRDSELSYGEGEVPAVNVLKFVSDEETQTVVIKSGTLLTNVPTAQRYGYIFKGWSVDGIAIFDFTNEIVADATFTALFIKNATWQHFDFDHTTYPVKEPPMGSSDTITQEISIGKTGASQYLNVRVKLYRVIFKVNENPGNPSSWANQFYCLNNDLSVVKGIDSSNCNLWMSLGESVEIDINGNIHVLTFEEYTKGKYQFSITNAADNTSYVTAIELDGAEFEIEA